VISLPRRPSAWAHRTARSRRVESRLCFFARGGATTIALTAFLSGCATYESSPLVPRDELELLRARKLDTINVDYSRPGQEKPQSVAFDLSDGLEESELVAVALTLNPSLRAKRLEIGEAQALLVSAGLWPNPEIGVAVRPGIDGASSSGIDLDALFELLRPGERSARRGVALAHADVVRAEIAALELRLVAEARKARIAVLAAEENERLLEGEATLREEASALLQRRKELGEATDLDLVLVDLERVAIQRDLREARAETLRSRRSLNELLGLPASYELALTSSTGSLSFQAVAIPSDEDLDQLVLSGRFDLHAKEVRYRQAEEELRLAVARQFPGLSVGPSFEKDGDGSKALGLGAGIEVPLFNRNQGEIAEKYAGRERARAEYVSTLHSVRAAAFAARAEIERAGAEIELQQREVLPLIERTEALFEGAFRARELSIFEWSTARSRALQARRELLRALVRHSAARADLEAALGVTPAPQVDDNLGNEQENK
jgi:outer membrane protein TolC